MSIAYGSHIDFNFVAKSHSWDLKICQTPSLNIYHTKNYKRSLDSTCCLVLLGFKSWLTNSEAMIGLVFPNAEPAWLPACEAHWFDPYCNPANPEPCRVQNVGKKILKVFHLQVYVLRCQIVIDKLAWIDRPV